MARVVNEQEFKARRNQILEVAKKLMYTIGYEQMSIQDILVELKMSKGAFYHYFDSKPILLEALIEHLIDEAEEFSTKIFQDVNLSPLEKISKWFDTSVRWKAAQKTYMLALLRVWYADDNAIIRQKMFALEIKRFAPLFAEVIRQGIQHGDLNTAYPDQVAEMIFYILEGIGDKFFELVVAYEGTTDTEVRQGILCSVENFMAAYTDTIGKLLGIPGGSLKLMDIESVRVWFEE
jgi:AcrR family transcriptional regulator